jgi:hypothetical protein
MTQRPIVAYLSLTWISAREIHDDIVAVLGCDAFDDADRFLEAVESVLERIEKATLQRSFWIGWTD